jgi:dihydrofolate reductase
MSTFAIVVTSSDGFMANESHVRSFEWNSKADKESFVNLTKNAGVVVMGSKTFETFAKQGEEPKPLKGRLNIIYSRTKKYTGEGVETTDKKPADLVRDIILHRIRENDNKRDIAVIGGAEIYKMFVEANEIDRIYVTVEPIKFGHGIPFWQDGWKKKFKLVPKSEYELDGTKFQTYERRF